METRDLTYKIQTYDTNEMTRDLIRVQKHVQACFYCSILFAHAIPLITVSLINVRVHSSISLRAIICFFHTLTW
jgi:uncharacterized radical SAM superfamily Fe-S cluster-containing enzyme